MPPKVYSKSRSIYELLKHLYNHNADFETYHDQDGNYLLRMVESNGVIVVDPTNLKQVTKVLNYLEDMYGK